MNFFKTRRRAILTLAASGAIGLAQAASAAEDNYPNRPIRMVLGFSAGGGTDIIARALAQKMSETLGVSVVVDNKPGANGNISAELVAKSPGDGYTLLYNTSSIVLSPGIYSKLGYDVLKDLRPVGLVANLPIVLVTSNKVKPQSVSALVTAMKGAPDTFNYASAGNGNITHFAMLMFQHAVGVTSNHIPYRGEAPAMADLMGAQVDLYMGTAPGVIPAIKDKRVRALAVTSLKRLPALPEVPTLSESVAKGLEIGAWSGIMAPPGTPDHVIARLNDSLKQALASPDVQAQFATQSAETRYATADQYGQFLRTELPRWRQIAQQANVKLD